MNPNPFLEHLPTVARLLADSPIREATLMTVVDTLPVYASLRYLACVAGTEGAPRVRLGVCRAGLPSPGIAPLILLLPDGDLSDEVVDFVSTAVVHAVLLPTGQRVGGDGSALDLVANPVPALPARVTLMGTDTQVRHLTLPADVRIHGATNRARLQVHLAGEDAPVGGVVTLVALDGQPIGDCVLALDLGGTGLVVSALQPRIRATLQLQGATSPVGAPRFDPARPLVVTVIVDRTACDPDAYPHLVQRAVGLGRRDVDDVFGGEADAHGALEPGSWNIGTRRALALALPAALELLHPKITLQLGWFADVPSDTGLARPDGLPVALASEGAVGEVERETLAVVLDGPAFSWVSGMDLIDGADVALGRVAHGACADRDHQHAVILVGDSPPPPSQGGPLWRALTTLGPAVGVRTGDGFSDALARLEDSGIPVGWLFLRSARGPEAPRHLAGTLALWPAYQSLREAVLTGLSQTVGLEVEATVDPLAPGAALGRLCERLGRASDRTPWATVVTS